MLQLVTSLLLISLLNFSFGEVINPNWKNLETAIDGNLYKITNDDQECSEARASGDAYQIIQAGNGTCTQQHINRDVYDQDLPLYSVEVKNVEDIKKAIKFANKHNWQISVKSTGHSFSGSGIKTDSLMIWMANMDKEMKIHDTFIPSNSGKSFKNILEFSGGLTWKEIYAFLGEDYHAIGGGCASVSASGGYLAGSGLSKMARKYGLAVDMDLFWALRGGGGGSFGIVSKVWYQIFPKEKVHGLEVLLIDLEVLSSSTYTEFLTSFNDFVIDMSLTSSNDWSGYTFTDGISINHVGEELDSDLIDKFDSWVNSLDPSLVPHVSVIKNQTYSNYYASIVTFGEKPGVGQGEGYNIGNRLLTHDWLSDNRDSAKMMFSELLAEGFQTFSYWLGGAINEVDHSSTAINPVLRKTILHVAVNCVGCDVEKALQIMDKYLSNPSTGYNH
eukprot:Awhi_evm1s2767